MMSTGRTPSPLRAPWRWAAAGLLLGLLPTLALQAPAYWLAAAVQRASGHQLEFTHVRGTLWNGSAQLQLTGGRESHDALSLPGLVHWRLRPGWTGAHVELNADCCTHQPVQMAAALGWGTAHVEVADSRSDWPATLLAGLGTPWNTVQLQGQLTLTTHDLTLAWAQGRMELGGQLQLDLLDMSSRLSTLHPLGSYRVSIQGGSAAHLTLSTLHGALQLSGSGLWVGQRLRFTGEATAAPGSEAVLSNLLNIIGRRSGARSAITIG